MCQNAAYLVAICDLELRFRATTGGKAAIWEIALLKRCDFVFAFGRPLRSVSIIAIGNRLRRPKGGFPAWVSKSEQDPLFWVSAVEGMSLLLKIGGAVLFFVMALSFDRAKCQRAMSRSQIGPVAHMRAARTSSHLVFCLAKASLSAVIFLMFLLHWNLYTCPQTLAMASACLRNSALIRAWVFVCWCELAFRSEAVEHLLLVGKNQKKQWTVKMLRKRLLLWLLWCVLTVLLSIVAILYQVGKSIPDFLPAGMILSSALKGCVGIIQAVVTNYILPSLASKLTFEKHALTAVSSLMVTCMIPAVIIMYLDTGSGSSSVSSRRCFRKRHRQ